MYQQVCTTAVWCGFTAIDVVTLMVYGRHVTISLLSLPGRACNSSHNPEAVVQLVFYLLVIFQIVENCH